MKLQDSVIAITGGDQGVIINSASISRAGNMGQSNYSAAKAGVSGRIIEVDGALRL